MKTVTVMGAGLVGMLAVIMACKEGAEILLVDRGLIGLGINSAMANGVFPTRLLTMARTNTLWIL